MIVLLQHITIFFPILKKEWKAFDLVFNREYFEANTIKFGLKNSTLIQIISVFSDVPQVEEAIIFGSRAKGNYRPASDIDITLKGDKLTLKRSKHIDFIIVNSIIWNKTAIVNI